MAEPYKRVTSLYKALCIIESFTRDKQKLTLAEITAITGINKSSVHRILATLEEKKFIKNLGNGIYTIGIRLFEIGCLANKSVGLNSDDIRPFIMKLSEATGETIHISILNEGDVLYVNYLDGPAPVRMVSEIGMRVPVHCTAMGNILLAYLPKEEVEEIIETKGLKSYSPTTIVNKDELLAKLETVKRVGYAIHDGEYSEGVCCISSPIHDYTGKVIAAMSASGPSYRVRARGLNFYIEKVIDCANQISAHLGYRESSKMG